MTVKRVNPLLLSQADIERVAPPRREIIAAVERAYRQQAAGQVEVPTKIGVHPSFPNSFLHAMPAWNAGIPAFGLKAVSYFPGNYLRGYEDSSALIVLYDAEHGQPAAIIEGMWITLARTAAGAAIAAKHLAKSAPERLGLVGCGGLGRWSLLMLAETFPSLREVLVSSKTAASRTAFCEKMRALGPWQLQPVEAVEDAVRDMDIVVSSTPQAPEPRLAGAWWSKGSLAIPLDYPYSWDDQAYAMADRLVADDLDTLSRYEATSRSGGRRPNLRFPAIQHALQDVVAEKASCRTGPNERAFAIVTGIASTDVAVAWEIYQRARQAGVGREFAFV